MDEIRWMVQPQQWWQADAGGKDESDDGGDAGGGDPDPSFDEGFADALDAGLAEAGGGDPGDEDDGPGAGGNDASDADVSDVSDVSPPAGAAEPKAPAAKPDKVEPDPVNDPIGEDLKGRTRERVTALVDRVKTLDAELQTVKGEYETFMSAVEETGAEPEQLGAMLNYLKLSNSEDPKDLERALAVIEMDRETIMERLGKPPSADLLDKYPDLKEEVEVGDISRERALEIAAARRSKDRQSETRQQQESRQAETQQEMQQAVAVARAQLTAAGQVLAADPLYAAKVQAMTSAGFREKLAKIHPTKWLAEFHKAYAAVEVRPVKPVKQEPMRAAGGSGTMTKEPQTIEEALEAGLAAAARR